MKKTRTSVFVLLVLSLAGIVALIFFVPLDRYRSAADRRCFWTSKRLMVGVADIVLAGSSRVYRGLSPAALSRSLGGVRVFNAGFSRNSFSSEYLNYVEKLLIDGGGVRAIVIGVNPHSLTEDLFEEDGFLFQSRIVDGVTFRFGLWQSACWLSVRLAPVSIEEVSAQFGFGSSNRGSQRYYANGWVASDLKVADPSLYMAWTERRLRASPVSPRIVAALLDRVQRWTREGIRVIGYRPPTSTNMEEMEARVGGFDAASFVRRFSKAGGVWINIEDDLGLRIYDGTHLDENSASRLSEYLGGKISSQNILNIR